MISKMNDDPANNPAIQCCRAAYETAYDATRRIRSPKSRKGAEKSHSGANKGALKAIQEPFPAPIFYH